VFSISKLATDKSIFWVLAEKKQNKTKKWLANQILTDIIKYKIYEGE